jgi:hypothetical protein
MDIPESPDCLLGYPVRCRHWVGLSWMLVVAFGSLCGQNKSSATFLNRPPTGQQIIVDFGDQLAYDSSANTVTLADGSTTFDLTKVEILSLDSNPPQLILAAAAPTPSPVPDIILTLTLSHFHDANDNPVSLDAFATGTKQYFVVLKSVKDGQVSTIPVTVKSGQLVKLTAETYPLKRNIITLTLENADATVLFNQLSKDLKSIAIVYDFGASSTVSNIKTRAQKVEHAAPFAIDIYPETPMPFHSTAYKVSIQIPKGDLPVGIDSSKTTATYPVTATANYPSPTVDKTNSIYDFEPTLTSSVNESKKIRSTSGLFALTLNPVLFLHETDVDGQDQNRSYWWDFRPNISANVDTLPEATSTTPNRVTIALDSELGLSRKRDSGKGFDNWTWTNGIRDDSDRDFRIFSTYWHTDVAPDFWEWSESQSYRTGHYTPIGQKPQAPKHLVVTAYRFRPSFGYEVGTTTVRSGTIDPTLGDSVSRVLLKIDTMIELWRNVTFSAIDTSYYLFDATRRSDRGFLDAQVALNTGLLLRMDTNKIQSAILFKYQRGEEPPKFTPTDTISVGFKIYK